MTPNTTPREQPDDRPAAAGADAGAGGAGGGGAAGGAVEHLPTAECWELLERTSLGRLAVVRSDGEPDIFPVNYLTHEGSLYLRTARDSKLLHIAHHRVVAFEIDGESDAMHWSVVVRGPADRVTSDTDLRESGVRGLHSWSPTLKMFAIRIAAHTVTGRRFSLSPATPGDMRAFEGSSELPDMSQADDPRRATRPTAIPHRTPITDTGATPAAPPRE